MANPRRHLHPALATKKIAYISCPARGSAIAVVAAIAILSTLLRAQSAPTLKFEVASIKPSPDKFDVLASMPREAAGRLFLSRPLRVLIQRAYRVENLQIIGGPSALMARRFDILAKAANPDATPAQMNEMLKSLLEERFQLKVHREMREVEVSVLKLASREGKLGPNLKPSTLSCLTSEELFAMAAAALGKGDLELTGLPTAKDPCGDRSPLEMAHVKGQPISTLLPLLSTRDRPFVQDRTGLTGRYDWDLTFDSRPLSTSPNADSPTGPPLLTALEQQLGLKVETEKGRVEFLVVDAAEFPTPD